MRSRGKRRPLQVRRKAPDEEERCVVAMDDDATGSQAVQEVRRGLWLDEDVREAEMQRMRSACVARNTWSGEGTGVTERGACMGGGLRGVWAHVGREVALVRCGNPSGRGQRLEAVGVVWAAKSGTLLVAAFPEGSRRTIWGGAWGSEGSQGMRSSGRDRVCVTWAPRSSLRGSGGLGNGARGWGCPVNLVGPTGVRRGGRERSLPRALVTGAERGVAGSDVEMVDAVPISTLGAVEATQEGIGAGVGRSSTFTALAHRGFPLAAGAADEGLTRPTGPAGALATWTGREALSGRRIWTLTTARRGREEMMSLEGGQVVVDAVVVMRGALAECFGGIMAQGGIPSSQGARYGTRWRSSASVRPERSHEGKWEDRWGGQGGVRYGMSCPQDMLAVAKSWSGPHNQWGAHAMRATV